MPQDVIFDPTVDQRKRTGAGTADNPLTDIQVEDLEARGFRAGDFVPERGVLTPYGTFNPFPTSPASGSVVPGTNIGADTTVGDALGTTSEGGAFAAPTPNFEPAFNNPRLTGADEAEIRQQQLQLFQGEIDATNQIFDRLVQRSEIEGEGRLGSQRAIAARGGILGSDFSTAQKDRVQQQNTDIIKGIEAERAARIASIMGLARKSAADEIAEKNKARVAGAQEFLDFLSRKEERQQSNMLNLASALFTQGVDPTEMSPQELNAIATEFRTTPEDIISTFTQFSAEQATESGDAFTLGPGERRFSPTGDLIAEGGASSAGDKIYSTSKGLVRIGADGKPELIFESGSGGSSGASNAFRSGNLEVSRETASEVSRALEGSRGDDGFVNTALYMDIVNQMLEQGAIMDDVLDQYDPRDYINPSDPTVPPVVKRRLGSDATSGLAGLVL